MFRQLTILTCVVSGKSNKGGALKAYNSLKRRVLVLILFICSLAWPTVRDLLLMSLYTAV